MSGDSLHALELLDAGRTEEAHDLVQNDGSDLGSYLHGMIHRDEGDLANARYWFHRAGELPERLGLDPMSVEKSVERAALADLPQN